VSSKVRYDFKSNVRLSRTKRIFQLNFDVNAVSKSVALAVIFVWISCTLAPFGYFFSLINIPCNSPPFMVSWLPECFADNHQQSTYESSSSSSLRFLNLLAVASCDTIMYWFAHQDILFHWSYNNTNVMSCLLQYIWLIEDHHKKTVIKPSVGFSSGGRDIHLYNGIVLLNKLIESRCSLRVFLPMWVPVGAIQIIFVYAVIHAGHRINENPSLVLVMIILGMNMVLANLLTTSLGGWVSVASKSLLQMWTKSANPRDKVRRRRLKALRLVCIRFGGKFMDRDTPIVTQDFLINQTVSLLLLHN
jgi:hypothetical protein